MTDIVLNHAEKPPQNGTTNGIKSPATGKYKRLATVPENPYNALIPSQTIAVVPEFVLECGAKLYNVPVAYKHYGKLSPNGDNAMVICHALTGSADVGDWWGPLMGPPGKAFDISRFFVICLNSLGSPYGSASPVTCKDGDPKKGFYGPEFPLTTVRDDVNIFKLILDDLGVKQIAAVVGGSMGGMLVLEFAYFGKDYVRTIIPIATSARYSAWGISWGEAQRQSIYSDPLYDDGYYAFDKPPATGLGAARMTALLTYRSRDSFESRFGRNIPDPTRRLNINGQTRPGTPAQPGHEHWEVHNDGHKTRRSPRISRAASADQIPTAAKREAAQNSDIEFASPFNGTPFSGDGVEIVSQPSIPKKRMTPHYFSAQSYLRYQGEKFIKRFDANCYIAITRKLDTHDISRNRTIFDSASSEQEAISALHAALAQIQQPALVLGIQSDGLFTFQEQKELAKHIPNSELKTIDSPDGHDAFLLEFEQVNTHLLEFLNRELPDIMNRTPVEEVASGNGDGAFGITKSSTFGEAEVEDITAW